MTGPGHGAGPPGPPYGHPGGYGGAGWPGADGQPYGQPPYGQHPPYGQGQPYGQGPPYGAPQPYPQPAYGQGYPPGPGGNRRAAAPATVWVGMALLILSAAPSLVGSVYTVIESFRAAPTSAVTGDPVGDLLVSEFTGAAVGAARASGVLIAIYALIYMVLAVVAALGKGWARTMLAVLTTLWGMLLLLALAALVSVPEVPGWAPALVGGVLVASIGGMVVLYLPVNRPYYATPRR